MNYMFRKKKDWQVQFAESVWHHIYNGFMDSYILYLCNSFAWLLQIQNVWWLLCHLCNSVGINQPNAIILTKSFNNVFYRFQSLLDFGYWHFYCRLHCHSSCCLMKTRWYCHWRGLCTSFLLYLSSLRYSWAILLSEHLLIIRLQSSTCSSLPIWKKYPQKNTYNYRVVIDMSTERSLTVLNLYDWRKLTIILVSESSFIVLQLL